VLCKQKKTCIPFTSLKFGIYYRICWQPEEAYSKTQKLYCIERKGMPPGNAYQLRRIYWRNDISAGNYWLLDEESIGGLEFRRKLPAPR
jgi:hypothetical protein